MKQFEAGKTYTTRSACDYDTIFSFRVIGRTAATVTLESNFGVKTCRIKKENGTERCKPLGSYSMAPVIEA